MAWRLVEISAGDELEGDLTDSELVGISIVLTHECWDVKNSSNVYWAAREKIQKQVDKANAA